MYLSKTLNFRTYLLLAQLLLLSGFGFAQRYGFQQYSVAEGLVQSQPVEFAQNKNRQLFIGTVGGISVFDGTDFTNYSKAQGLPNNSVTALALDSAQLLWIGTQMGISRFDGRKFVHYFPKETAEESRVSELVVDGHNRVWALVERTLYLFQSNRFVPVGGMDSVMCLTVDRSGKLWAFKYRTGLMVLVEQEWHVEVATDTMPEMLVYGMAFGHLSGSLYCTSSKGLKTVEKGRFVSPDWAHGYPGKNPYVHTVFEDRNGHKWLAGSGGGIWCRRGHEWIYYHFGNGFTNEVVTDIFEDSEGNVWFASDGSGIFKFTGNIFTLYERTGDLAASNIMAITQQADGTLYFSGSNRGFFSMRPGGGIEPIALPEGISRINTMFADRAGTIWLGSNAQGIWKYAQGRFSPLLPDGPPIVGITHIETSDSSLWVASLSGLFRFGRQKGERINLPFQVHTTLALSADTLLLGTFKGAYLWHAPTRKLIGDPLVQQANVLCLAAKDAYVFIGTDDRGVVVWDRARDTSIRLNQKSGLSCDYVYSLLPASDGSLWVGTGCGIDRIVREREGWNIEKYGASAGRGLENNNNAVFEDQQGMLWFGTTQGVYRYNPYADQAADKNVVPKVMLTGVRLFSKELDPQLFPGNTLPFSNIPSSPLFKPKENHLTFSFKAVSLRFPGKIKYRYQLEGADPSFTETEQTTVIYPNLPPGDYVFKVWASDAAGNWHDNAVLYPFTINTPYFATWYFRVGLAFLLISFFLALVYLRNRQKARRIAWGQQLKEDARARVRQKIAEDFHDEIGNKLTRIKLLTTVMKRKLKTEAPQVSNILDDIQKNVSSLYQGSRDIIWSLQPQSSYLDEVLFHIKENTLDMLEGSGIEFSFELSQPEAVPLLLEGAYPRDLIMIFKEAVNNIVKHAEATGVEFRVLKQKEGLRVQLLDNGKGMPAEAVGRGNGLKNMKNRAARIAGLLEWLPNTPQGTVVQLSLDWKKLRD